MHKASTVLFANTAALRARTWKEKTGYTYGLHGTPTTFILEERIATLEGGLQTLLTPSGLAAITLVDAALLKSGDEVLIPDNAYGPAKELARNELARWGIAHRFYDPMEPESLRAALSPATRLVWLEPPGSVTMEFPDLPALLRLRARAPGGGRRARQHLGRRARLRRLRRSATAGEALGADISIQALTKYPSGGADLLMGAVTTRDEALHQRLKATHMRMGWGVGGNDVEAVLRSLPSLALRYAAQDRAGRELAAWWAQAARGRRRAPSGAARLAGACALGRALLAGRRPVLGRLRRPLRRRPGRCLHRRAEAVQDRLLVGRAGEPGGAVRPGGAARSRRRAAARWCASRSASRRSRT